GISAMKYRPITALLTLILASTIASAGPPPPDPQTNQMLTAMFNASTWGHPDLFGEFAGTRYYFEGKYASAMTYFKIGARYADKLSQLSIGLMYENGEGVDKDPATACAWLALAAERKYPGYIDTRDRVCKALTPAQHDQAVAVLDKLMPEYGDAVAKKRMARALQMALMEGGTGSRLGFDSGINTVGNLSPGMSCGGPSIIIGGKPLPQAGCGAGHQYYDPVFWDPKQYFAARDAQWRGTVTVGNVQDLHEATQAAQKSTPPAATSGDAATHR